MSNESFIGSTCSSAQARDFLFLKSAASACSDIDMDDPKCPLQQLVASHFLSWLSVLSYSLIFRPEKCPQCKVLRRKHRQLSHQSQCTFKSSLFSAQQSTVLLLKQEKSLLRLQNRQLDIQSNILKQLTVPLANKICKWQAKLSLTKAKLSYITWKIYCIVERVYTQELQYAGDQDGQSTT